MKRYSLLCAYICVFFLNVCIVCGTTLSELQAQADGIHANQQEPSEGVSLGSIENQNKWVASAGKMSESGRLVDENTLYEIGSITKVFTGILLADTVLQGKADLNDSIAIHLGEDVIPAESPLQEVTLLQLSTHTSGLPRLPDDLFGPVTDSADPYAHYSREDLFQYLKQFEASDFEIPGEYSYSNLAVGLLGEILSVIHDKPYEALLKDRILDPLGMNSTFVQVSADSVPDELSSRFATGHVAGKAVSNWRLNSFSGAGAIVSSVEDLLVFAKAHWDCDTPQYLQDSFNLAAEKHSEKVGLGWHFFEKGVVHAGGTGGFRTELFIDSGSRIAKVSLRNSAGQASKVETEGDFEQIEGFWEGALDLGVRKLRLVLHVAQDGSGRLYSIDQGGTLIPSSKSSFVNGSFDFQLPSVNGFYSGQLIDGHLDGTWNQGGELPLTMVRSESMPASLRSIFENKFTGDLKDIVGFWSGAIGEGGLFIYLEISPFEGTYDSLIWSPSQSSSPIGVSRLEFQDSHLIVESKAVGGYFEGDLLDNPARFEGEWTQGQVLPVSLTWSKNRPD